MKTMFLDNDKLHKGNWITARMLSDNVNKELQDNFSVVSLRVDDIKDEHIQEDKIRIYLATDNSEHPDNTLFKNQEMLSKFHKCVFVSNYQYNNYRYNFKLPYDSRFTVMDMPLYPSSETCLKKGTDKIRIVYTAAPQKGLDILVPVFKYLKENHHDNIHLDVFSGFTNPDFNDKLEKEFKELFDEIDANPNMTNHGFIDNLELRTILNDCHIFAYPSVWYESSCRSVIEAMSAGLVCVHPNMSVLPEATGCLNIMYQGDSNPNIHGNIFMNNLHAAISFVENGQHHSMISFNKTYVDGRYGIDRISGMWELLLSDLLKQYPTPESRKSMIEKTESFSYKTD